MKYWVQFTIERTSAKGQSFAARVSRLHTSYNCWRIGAAGGKKRKSGEKSSILTELEFDQVAANFLGVCQVCTGELKKKTGNPGVKRGPRRVSISG